MNIPGVTSMETFMSIKEAAIPGAMVTALSLPGMSPLVAIKFFVTAVLFFWVFVNAVWGLYRMLFKSG